ncbi:MAG: ABC transporter substrate-binding protein [Chloroflexi bacterium]|nr:ABC transporter substrate-binding protein [Chloroflexota bacterium]
MKRSLSLPCFLVAFLLLAVGCAPGAKAPPTPIPTAHVKVSSLPYLTWGPLYIAEEEGFFAQQNIEIEWVKMGSTEEYIPLLSGGDIDVGAGGVGIGFLNAVAGGIPIKAVAGKGHLQKGDCSSMGIVARQALYDSGELDRVEELKGRKVATSAVPTLFGYLLGRTLASANLSLEDVKIVRLPIPATFGAYKQGSIDASIGNEPIPTRMEGAGLAHRLAAFEDIAPDFQYAFIVFGPNLLEKDPGLGQRFLAAYLQGIAQFNKGKTARNLEILSARTGQDVQVLQRVCWPAIYADGHVDMSGTMDFQNWAQKHGFFSGNVAKDDLFQSSLLDAARQAQQ